MNLENIILSEKKSVTYCMIPFIAHVQNKQTHRNRKQIGTCQGLWGEENGEKLLNSNKFPPEELKIFWD